MADVVHVITGLNIGGAEKSLYNLLMNGLGKALPSHVISLTDLGKFGPLLIEAGVPVTCLNMTVGRVSFIAFLKLVRELRRLKPKIIQGWMYHGNFAASAAGFFVPGGPSVLWNVRTTLEQTSSWPLITRLLVWAEAYISPFPKVIVYNSYRSKFSHESRGYSPDNGVVIPNGFDTDIWAPSEMERTKFRDSIGVPSDAILLAFVGRNHPQKNLAGLLTSLHPVMLKNLNLYLLLVGRDISYDTPGIAEPLSSLDRDRVIILDERPDIPSVMASLDFFCLPSNLEGFPNVIGEAMSSGVPCIATDVGDSASIVGRNGWVVPPSNTEVLSEALFNAVALTPEERRCLGLLARQSIAQNYSLSSVVNQYLKLYTDTLRNFR